MSSGCGVGEGVGVGVDGGVVVGLDVGVGCVGINVDMGLGDVVTIGASVGRIGVFSVVCALFK